MNLIDTGAWLAYLADEANADFFATVIEDRTQCIVCAHSVFEVYHRIRLEHGEALAIQAAAIMRQGKVIALDADLSMDAAECAAREGLRFPAAVVLCAARRENATLWTTTSALAPFPETEIPSSETAEL